MPIFETVLTFVEDAGDLGGILESAAEVGSDVVTTVGDTYFGLNELNALNPVDPFFSGLDAAAGAYDTVGNFAGSSGFWDTFSPGSILNSAAEAVGKFGSAIDSALGSGFKALGEFDLAKTLGFAAPVNGLDTADQLLGQQITAAGTVISDPYSLQSLAQQGQDLIAAAGGSANPFSDLQALVQKLVPTGTFDIGKLITQTATQVGAQAISSLFGGGTGGQLAARVFTNAAAQVGVATNPQVPGPNTGPQLPRSQSTTVVDNSYGGGSAAEYNAINYSIRQQQVDDAGAGVTQAQDNFDSQQRTYEAATESLKQATGSVEAYDRLLAESGLSEQEIADLTAQRDAAAAQLEEARYQVQVSQQDLVSASDQLDNANTQYDRAVASATSQPISPNQDPTVNTNPVTATGTNQVGPFALNRDVNTAVAALGGQLASQTVAQLTRTAQNVVANVAAIPAAVAAQIGNIVTQAAGVSPGSDGYAAVTQAVIDQLRLQGVDPNILTALARTAEGTIDQALLDQARNVATLRQQQQNPAQSGDWRVRLRLAPQSNYLYNAAAPGILQPLKVTDGVIFPYTPRIDTSYRADYDTYALTHSNYRGLFYKSSYVDAVNINAMFTAQDTPEANYLLAVIHFFRSVTKMFYGQDALRGAPPPLVFLSGLGEYQFNEHPCVVTNFSYNLPDNVDYIRAYSAFPNGTNLLAQRDRFQGVASNPLSYALQRLASVGLTKGALDNRIPPPTLGINNPNYVPTKIDIQLSLLPVQSRSQVSKQFSLQNFANGNLLKGGFW